MDDGVFISYRRDDSAGYTRALTEALRPRLGERSLFVDVDSIEPGVDFVTSIRTAVGRCEALIAVIGKGWLDAADASGQRRLDDEHDYVHIEIATALERDVRVIPVLLDGVKMPSEEALPEPLKALSRRNAVNLNNDQFAAGIDRLAEVLGKGEPVAPAEASSSPPAAEKTSTRVKVAWTGALGVIVVALIQFGPKFFAASTPPPPAAPTVNINGGAVQNTGSGVQVIGAGNTVKVEINPQATVDALIRAQERAIAAKDETLVEKDRRITELERRLAEGGRRQQLVQAVEALDAQAQRPEPPPGIPEALAALARGETVQAEAIFAAVSKAAEASGDAAQEQRDAAYREAAAAQRHLGALAFLNDTSRALAAYEQAARIDPGHLETWFQLGQVRQYAGQLAGAQMAFEQALALSDKTGNEREVAWANTFIGDVRRDQGDLAGALDAYQQSMAIRERLAGADPSNTEWQRDLSVSHNKIGDVRRAQGDLAGALDAYQQGRAIAERLTAVDPSNTGWQRDLSVSHNKIGDVRRAQGDLAGALDAYQQDLAITERLAAADPSNFEWQRDILVSRNKIGEVRGAQGDLVGALENHEQGLVIAKGLVATDSSNTEWQRDLSISHSLVGDVRRAQGDLAGALDAYQQGLAIAERLATADPSNFEWQRDIWVSRNKIGEVHGAQGDLVGALENHEHGLVIAKGLVATDSSNTEWQRDLSISHSLVGDVRRAQGDLAGALDAYQQGLAIAERLATADPSNTEWQTDVVVSCWKVAAVLKEIPGNAAEAHGYLERGLAILTLLQERSLLAPSQAGWIGALEEALADLHGSGGN